ncbi:MAG TPA: insulinase family protein, partial [Nitriliruptorales bacterium]
TAQIQTHVRGTLHGQCPTALVTGDLATLDIAAIGQRVATAFAHARPAPAPRFTTPQTDPTRSVVLVDRPRAVQSVLAIGHLAPSRHHPDHTALYLGVGLLGGAFHSRLNLQLREERGYTYGARAQHLARRDVGALVLRTSVAAAATAPSLADVDTVVSRLLVYGATREEVDATRDARVRRSPQRFETVRSTGDAVAGLLALGIEPHDVGAFEAELPHIQLRDVDEALRHHLRPEAMTAVVVGPADRIRGEVERLDLGRLVVVRDRPD